MSDRRDSFEETNLLDVLFIVQVFLPYWRARLECVNEDWAHGRRSLLPFGVSLRVRGECFAKISDYAKLDIDIFTKLAHSPQ